MSVFLRKKYLIENSTKGKLPDFIVIGGMKCGTTSLFNYLGLHPEICSSEVKEPCFFVDKWESGKLGNYHKKLDWYKALFRNPEKICGEFSTDYTKFPAVKGVASRIYSLLPHVKLIYVVRNPIDRIISHYVHYIAEEWGKNESIDKYLQNIDNHHAINCSRYYMQLSQYLEYFPLSQFLVIKFEDLINNKLSVLRRIFDFLNVSPDFIHNDFNKTYLYPNSKDKLTRFGKLLNINPKISKVLERQIKYIKKVKPLLISQKVDYPELTFELKKKIINVLIDEIHNLEKLFYLDLSDWYTEN